MRILEACIFFMESKKQFVILGLLCVKIIPLILKNNPDVLDGTVNTIMNNTFALVNLAKEIQCKENFIDFFKDLVDSHYGKPTDKRLAPRSHCPSLLDQIKSYDSELWNFMKLYWDEIKYEWANCPNDHPSFALKGKVMEVCLILMKASP